MEGQETGAVPKQHEIDVGRLEAYLAANLPAGVATRGVSPMVVSKFKTGQSNPTYLLKLPGGERLVMRKKPAGKLLSATAHAVEREFRVIRALETTDVPVPKAYCLCTDGNVIGTPFYVMQFVEGRIYTDLSLGDCPDKLAHFHAILDALARLHRVDPAAVGLSDFGMHGNFYKRQISRMRQTSDAQAQVVAALPHLDAICKWFDANLPADDATVARIVHGDFKPDNVIFHPTKPVVIGILDWEMSTIGNPLSDLANLNLPYHMGKADVPLASLNPADDPGVPDEQEYVRRYCGIVGRPYPLPQYNFYVAFAALRLAVILQGIAARAKRGQASSAAAEAIGELAPGLANLCHLLQHENSAKL